MSHDPLEYIDSYNMYAFALLDPVNFWDPWGLDANDVSCDATCRAQQAAERAEQRVAAGFLKIDEVAVKIGNANRRFTEGLEAANRPRADMSTGELLGRATAASVIEIYKTLTPQSGEDVWTDTILSAAAAAGKGLSALRKATRNICSFTEDTPVLMCDGTLKSIQDVEAGDWVMARDKETGEVACREVANPYSNPNRSIILVTLESVDGTTEVIETTDNHPFFVEGRGWTRVDELVPGDLVPSASNGLLVVTALEWTDRIEVVYNFGVDEFNTYFVGEIGAWVHNCAFAEAFEDMSKSARKSLQHAYDRHGKELGLPNWQGKKGEELRKQFNIVTGYIKDNAQKTVRELRPYGEKGSGLPGKKVEVNTHLWRDPQSQRTYYYTETLDGKFVSSGLRTKQ
jgi:hypothetical protein